MNKIIKTTFSILGLLLFSSLIILGTSIIFVFLDIPFPNLVTINNLGNSLKPFVEVLAIITAGLWSYRLFIKSRTEYPFAQTHHIINNINLDNGNIYLTVFVILKNSGKVKLNIENSKVYVQQITPLLEDISQLIEVSDIQDLREGNVENLFINNSTQIAWKEIGYRETCWGKNEIVIEPGEQEELQFDFILDDDSQIIKVTTYFENKKLYKHNIGWKKTSIYNLEKGEHMSQKKESRIPHIPEKKKSQTAPKRPPSKPKTPSQKEPERTDPKSK